MAPDGPVVDPVTEVQLSFFSPFLHFVVFFLTMRSAPVFLTTHE